MVVRLIQVRERDGREEVIMQKPHLEEAAIVMSMLAGESTHEGALHALKNEHEAIVRDGEFVYIAEVIHE